MSSKGIAVLTTVFMLLLIKLGARAEGPVWSVDSSSEWKRAATMSGVQVRDSRLVLDGSRNGQWSSNWHEWGRSVDASMNLFDNKTINVVVDGSETPFTDADQVPHDWYGRCMIAIVDDNRWVMAIRSGVNHISWQDPDAIHVLTSNDEGRSWSKLDQWFDGTPIRGMPFEDGHTHSEPGLYRMPNGDLILQFWRTNYVSGTRQLRSTDNGKTWLPDIDRINLKGASGADGSRAIGTEDYFVDPENPSDVYMSIFQSKNDPETGLGG